MYDIEKDLFEDGLEEYPKASVFIENIFMFLWIAFGSFLCWMFIPLIGWIYLGFGLVMVLFVMRILVCKNCYYHGERCHIGWGKLSASYCNRGDLNHFGKGIGGIIVPIFYASIALFPLIFGTISLIREFSLIKVCILMTYLLIFMTSSFIQRKKACSLCKMKNICPGSAAK